MLSRLATWVVPQSRILFWLWLLVLGLLTLGGEHLTAWHEYRLAKSALANRNYSFAKTHLERCLFVWPRSIGLKLDLAHAERVGGSLDQAENYLEELRAMTSDLPERYRIEMLLLDVQRGSLKERMPVLLRYLASENPYRADILETVVLAHITTGETDRAFYLLDQWEKWDPGNSMIYDLRGMAFIETNNIESAVPQIEKAVELSPERMQSRITLCELYLIQFKLEALRPQVQFLLERYPDHLFVRLVYARFLLALNRYQDAQLELAAVLRQAPNNLTALIASGETCLNLQEYRQASDFFHQVLAQDPTNVNVWHMLERCLTHLNDPEQKSVRATIAQLKARQERLTQLTQRHVKRKEPLTVEEQIERGELSLQLGKENLGLQELYGLVARYPNNQRVHQILADFFSSKNDESRAREHRNKLASLQKTHPEAASK